jgi:small subunit ribosomal protein S1
MEKLLVDESYTAFPNVGETVKGYVIAVGRNEVRVDINGMAVGIVRGPELDPNLHLTAGDEVEATVIASDNEFGELELSLKGADRKKSWEKLKELFTSAAVVSVKVLEAKQESVLAKYKVGDKVEGDVTAVTDFGAFVRFDTNLEGLVHISEIAWQRIDHPRDVLKVGDHVRAEIINLEGSKIFLSMKKLVDDPWKSVGERFKVNQIVRGRVLKINPFGLFVELDPDIHGLAHISELSNKPVKDVNEIARMGDEFDFRIVTIDPENHRLGLSLRKAKEETKEEAKA